MDMGLTQPASPSSSWENRRRPTGTPSTAIAFFASRIAANSLRHNALSSDPEGAHSAAGGELRPLQLVPVPFLRCSSSRASHPVVAPYTPTTERLPSAHRLIG